MEPLTRWEIFVNWLLSPWVWTQCRSLDADGYYCQRRCWHLGKHKYFGESEEGRGQGKNGSGE